MNGFQRCLLHLRIFTLSIYTKLLLTCPSWTNNLFSLLLFHPRDLFFWRQHSNDKDKLLISVVCDEQIVSLFVCSEVLLSLSAMSGGQHSCSTEDYSFHQLLISILSCYILFILSSDSSLEELLRFHRSCNLTDVDFQHNFAKHWIWVKPLKLSRKVKFVMISFR